MSFNKFSKEKKYLIIIFIIAIILRMLLFFIISPYTDSGKDIVLVGDAPGYHKIASLLSDGEPFYKAGDHLSTIRTPGYPAFLTFFYFLFGQTIWIPLLVQIILDSLLIFIIFKTARLFLNKKSALIASFLWAIEPFSILFSNALLSDSLFVWLILLNFYWFFKYIKYNKSSHLYISSLFIALSALVRPISLYLFVVLLSVIIFNRLDKIIINLKKISIYITIFLILIGGWIVRNKLVHDHYFLSTSGNFNALVLYAESVVGEQNKDKIIQKINKNSNETIKNDKYLLYKKYGDHAKNIILDNKLNFIKKSIIGTADMFFTIEKGYIKRIFNIKLNYNRNIIDSFFKNGIIDTSKYIIKNSPSFFLLYMFLIIIFLVCQYLLAIIGIIIAIKQKKFNLLYLLIPILYFILITGAAGIGRLKIPIIPFYLILSASGIKYIWDKINKTNYTINSN